MDSVVRKDFFQVALWLSVVYLVMVLATILMRPFVVDPDLPKVMKAAKAIELMHTSNLWLGPFQGLVASALGVLFVSKQEKAVNVT